MSELGIIILAYRVCKSELNLRKICASICQCGSAKWLTEQRAVFLYTSGLNHPRYSVLSARMRIGNHACRSTPTALLLAPASV